MRLEVKSCEVSDLLSLDSVSKTFAGVFPRSLESKYRILSPSLSKISDASLIALSILRQDENLENEAIEVSEEQEEWIKSSFRYKVAALR